MAISPSSSDKAGDPGHCALCGVPDPWCLCPRCLAAHTVDGVLPEWAAELRRLAQRKTKQERRHPLVFEPLGEDW